MTMITKILDKATDEISAVIEALWGDKEYKGSYEDYAQVNQNNVDWIKVKDRLDYAQELLLNLMISIEEHEKRLVIEFWDCAKQPNSTLKSAR